MALILSGPAALLHAEPAATQPAGNEAAPITPAPAAATHAVPADPTAPPLNSMKERLSYTMGCIMALQARQQQIDLEPEIVARGLKDQLGGKPRLTQDEMQQVMTQLMQELQARQAKAMGADVATKNKTEGEAFLAKNKTAEGVKTTASGIQYKVIKEGAGKAPAATDTVTVNYRGTLINGEEFDASAKHGGPATFVLNLVIPGWTEGVQLMKEGAQYEFYLPSNLAYGAEGRPPAIGPNAVLIFQIELIKVEPAK
ncbi:MAG: FKBP-type peptidyl-prolyl cis-trans isomerase [Planctomycetes bacterium]|nr:FKBP-type peptidyl-prolyl cis-trans isomerase [Planctomycetota bacterium]